MLKPRKPRSRSRAPLSLSGPTILALHSGYDAQLNRLAEARPWQVDPSANPSLGERVQSFGARLLGGSMLAEAPPLPEALTSLDAVYDRDVGYALASDVAVIGVEGVLAPKGYYDWWEDRFVYGYTDIADALLTAQDDERVGAILICIDSPGGIAYGCDELAQMIRQNSQRTGRKPVVAHITMAFSAAQYIASACDATFGPRGAGLGSIGVRMGWFDFSKMMTDDGVKREEFVSGEFKDAGSPFRPVTDAERAMFQADIDAHAGFFFDAVAAGRGIDASTVRGWQARTFTVGAEGDLDPEAAGLLDGVLTESEAFAAARDMAGLAPLDARATPVQPEPAATARAATERPARRMSSNTGGKKEEDTMSLKASIAALRAKAANGDKDAAKQLRDQGIALTAAPPKKNKTRARLRAEGNDPDPDEEDDETDPEAEGDGTDPDPVDEDGETDPDAEGDDEDEMEGEGDDKEALAQQLIAAATKQGKPKFGQRLAIQVASGSRSYTAALADLKAAARETNPLKDAMGGGRGGAAPTAGTSPKPSAGLKAAMDKRLGIKPAAKAS